MVVLTADHGDYIPIIEFGKEKIDLEASDSQAKMDYALWKIGKKVVPDKLKPLKKKISHFIRDSRIKSNEQKMNDLNLSPYQTSITTKSSSYLLARECFDFDGIKILLLDSNLKTLSFIVTSATP